MKTSAERARMLVDKLLAGEHIRGSVEELSLLGEEGVRAILEMRSGADRMADEELGAALFGIASVDAAPILRALQSKPGDTDLIWALGGARSEAATDALIDALKHRDVEVRSAAAAALFNAPSLRAQEALIQSVDDRSSRVRFSALRALCECCDARAAPALRRVLEDPRQPVGATMLAKAALSRLEADG